MVVWAYDPSTQEVESGRPEIQGHPWLNIESEASLVYRRFYFNKTKSIKQTEGNRAETPGSVLEMVQWPKGGVRREGAESPDEMGESQAVAGPRRDS